MLCLLLVGREKERDHERKKKRETAMEIFSNGQTCLAGSAAWDFHGW
jgi:hypothetical protein